VAMSASRLEFRLARLDDIVACKWACVVHVLMVEADGSHFAYARTLSISDWVRNLRR